MAEAASKASSMHRPQPSARLFPRMYDQGSSKVGGSNDCSVNNGNNKCALRSATETLFQMLGPHTYRHASRVRNGNRPLTT